MLSPMKIKFSIIGCGRIAQRHAEHIHRQGELVSVCDIDPEKAKTLGEKYGVPFYSSIETLLTRSPSTDVVSVCTPNYLHGDHTLKALHAGKHVICEKPMALSVEDCQRMNDTAAQTGKRLFIVKQNRFNPPVIAVKKLLDEKRLGALHGVALNCFWNRDPQYYTESSWKGSREKDGGVLFTQFSHFIDLLYWFLGDIAEIKGYAANLQHGGCIEFEDTGVISARWTSGVLGTIHYTVNSFRQNMEGSITLFGEKGTVKVGGQYLNELDYQNIDNYRISDLAAGNPANHYGGYQGSMSNHDKVYENVIAALRGGQSFLASGYEGQKTVEIINTIYSSITKL